MYVAKQYPEPTEKKFVKIKQNVLFIFYTLLNKRKTVFLMQNQVTNNFP